MYTKEILDIYVKHNNLINKSFNNDNGFQSMLDRACIRFINHNAITKSSKTSSKSSELLAKYCDILLKTSSKNPEENELEDALNQGVSFFFKTLFFKKKKYPFFNSTFYTDDNFQIFRR